MGRLATLLFGLFAVAVFVASAAVHALSLIPGTVLPWERIIWLHLGALLAFIPAGIHSACLTQRARQLGHSENEIPMFLGSHVPCGLGAIIAALFLYAILNFVQFATTVEGQAELRGDTYVLTKKSVVLRQISEAEYHENRRLHARGFSGHWLVFSAVAAVYFLVVAPRVREELSAAM